MIDPPTVVQQESNLDLWSRQNQFIYFIANFQNDFEMNAQLLWGKSSLALGGHSSKMLSSGFHNLEKTMVSLFLFLGSDYLTSAGSTGTTAPLGWATRAGTT